MNDLKILTCEEIEGKICEPINSVDEFRELLPKIEEMVQYCGDKGGGGIAGPQVGIFKNFFIYMRREGVYQVAVNPKFFSTSKKIKVLESCFSCLDSQYAMNRHREIQAVYYVLDKNELVRKSIPLKGVPAVIFQHEYDHLIGKTIQFNGEEIKRREPEVKPDIKGETGTNASLSVTPNG